jgi:hypothetical protein
MMAKEDTRFCLVATDGDCSKNGMGNWNEVIPFDCEHKELVRDFLLAHADLRIACSLLEYEDPTMSIKTKRFYSAFNDLKDVGVFDHKWHSRTDWVIEVFDLDYIDEVYGPSFEKNLNTNMGERHG